VFEETGKRTTDSLTEREGPRGKPTVSSVVRTECRPMALPTWSTELVGLVAGICTTAAFVPQVIRVWRLKRADEISLTTFLVFSVGLLVWLVYGLLTGALPVILANAVTFVLALMILSLKWRFDTAQRRATPP
jgi:MtN3 and saliva related transmembrane protein